MAGGPGGARFVETFDDWFVSINKRIRRLERRTTGASTAALDRVESRVPQAGFVALWAGASVPEGWLACDGSTHSTEEFPDLAGVLGAQDGTFTVPDLPGPAGGVVYIVRT